MSKGYPVYEPVMHLEDGSGVPYSGAKVNFYLAGTSTLVSVFSDRGLTTPRPNPVETASDGRLPVCFLNPDLTYKIDAHDINGVQIPGYPVDDFKGVRDIGVYESTPEEIAVSIPIVGENYLPGDFRRYGVLPDTNIDLTADIKAVMDIGINVFVPAGTYIAEIIEPSNQLIDMDVGAFFKLPDNVIEAFATNSKVFGLAPKSGSVWVALNNYGYDGNEGNNTWAGAASAIECSGVYLGTAGGRTPPARVTMTGRTHIFNCVNTWIEDTAVTETLINNLHCRVSQKAPSDNDALELTAGSYVAIADTIVGVEPKPLSFDAVDTTPLTPMLAKDDAAFTDGGASVWDGINKKWIPGKTWKELGSISGSTTGQSLGTPLTNVPAGCDELELLFESVSTDGSTGAVQIEIGDAGYAALSEGSWNVAQGGGNNTGAWAGGGPAEVILRSSGLDFSASGIVRLRRIPGGNKWVVSSLLGDDVGASTSVATAGGYIDNAGDEITSIKITIDATDNFDGGTVYVRAYT